MSIQSFTTYTPNRGATKVVIKRDCPKTVISIYQNDQLLQESEIVQGFEYESDYSKFLKIWRSYENIKASSFVIRSGLGLFGCYTDYEPTTPPDYRRPESVSEHASGCVAIARGIETHYRDLFSPKDYERIVKLLEIHDIGENIYGDHPDDGSQNAAEKDATELYLFVKHCLSLSEYDCALRIHDFINFQDCAGLNAAMSIKPDRKMAQFARIIDKTEAILSGLVREKAGFGGQASHKEYHYSALTSQDREYINDTNNNRLVDTWAAHFFDQYFDRFGFAYMFNLIRSAVVDTRGKWFTWFPEFQRKHNIPPDCLELDH